MTSRHSDNPDQSQEAVFRFLADPRTHGLSEPVGRVDTANAVVFLAGPDAYKVKRAVKFPFMDLSTLDKRREACEAEIAVNRAWRRQFISRRCRSRDRAGRSRSGGTARSSNGSSICADSTRTPRSTGSPNGAASRTRSSTRWRSPIRRSHARAPLRDAARASARARDLHRAERRRLRRAARSLRPADRAQANPRFAACVRDRTPGPAQARRAGFVRRCHGDLHLRNIALIDGEPTLFDAVEFSDEIASGDVLYDLAFLLMDLEERGLRAAANRLFNRYLAPEPPDALTGLVALPLFLSLRAAIRAKVEAAGADRLEGEKRDEARSLARRYFDLRDPVSRLPSTPAGRRRRALRRRKKRARRARSPLRSAGRPARSGCAATLSARRCSQSRRQRRCQPRPI